jgi:AcrR family transcriptional regulator
MARPRSEDKRNAILSAATRVIVADGLGATTAKIARVARISNGSLFTYFETKADLLNALYLELKEGMAAAALEGVSTQAKLRDQLQQLWANWTRWAVEFPNNRRALAQLQVSEEITPATRAAAHRTLAPLADILEQARAKGPLRDSPMAFVVSLMNSMAESTMDFMVGDPAGADEHSRAGFSALWRVIA